MLIAVITILAAMLLAGLAKAKLKAQRTYLLKPWPCENFAAGAAETTAAQVAAQREKP